MATPRGKLRRGLARHSVMLALGCAAVGAVLIGTAVAAQKHAPAPAPAAAGRITVTAPPSAAAAGQRRPPPAGSRSPALSRSPAAAISVPALGISDSPLQQLGDNPDGSVAVPTSFHRAGWFTGSVAPGQPGPTVILGHVDSYQGPGIFFRLGTLRPGDLVSVRRADGRVITYRITGVREYAKSSFPTIAVYANTPLPTIRLITCGGAFDQTTRHYLSNVVAFGVQA